MAGAGDIVYNLKIKGDASGGEAAIRALLQELDGLGAKARDVAAQVKNGVGGAGVNVGVSASNDSATISANTNIKSAAQIAKEAEQANLRLGRASDAAFHNVESNFNRAFNAASRMVNGMRQVFQGLQELGFYLTTFVSAPLMLLFQNGFQSASAFEQQMAKVQKAVQIPKDALLGFDVLEQRLRNLAKITPTSAEQLGVFAEQAGQLGIEGVPAVYRFVNLVNKMAVGTDVAANSIAEELGRIAAAFGMDLNTEEGISQLEKLSSVMDFVAKRTSTNMDGIITAMQDAASVGPLLKIPAKDVAVMVGMIITSGQDASAAGTILTQFFVQTLKNADKFAASMKGYSRDIVDANGNITKSFEPYGSAEDVIKQINADPVQVLKDSLDALNKTAEPDKALAVKNFFEAIGFRGGRIGAVAANVDNLNKLLADGNYEWDHATTLQMDYERMLLTTTSAVQIFKNNINDLGITIGSYVMPYINQAIQLAIPIIQDLGKAFEGLDNKTKLLVVGIPILLAVLAPILFLLSMMGHVVGLIGGGFVSVFMGMTQAVFTFVSIFRKLGSATGVLGGIAKAVRTLTGATGGLAATTGEAAVGLSGVVGALAGMLKFTTIGGIIAAALTGALKILSMFGLDVSTFFNRMADDARSWGENLMATYGTGMMAGAARVISKVVSTVAGWIARFFEAHSPPVAGPLSDIDNWGTGLMNTYLKGFLLADFSILSDVSSLIEHAFDDIAAINNIDLSTFTDQFIGMREKIAELIKVFNDTGSISESILSQIGTGLGSLGTDIQELIRRWLVYKGLQEQLAKLDEKKKTTLKTYDGEIARISKLNISAEEKAELIRKAQKARDEELRKIEEEKKKTQEAADAAKDKLDWQKEYVQAQLDILDLLKKQNDEKKKGGSGGADEMNVPDFSGVGAGAENALNPVKDLGEEINSWSEKIDSARSALDQFKAGFAGKAFGDGMDKGEKDSWQQSDPAGYKNAQTLYDLGKKAKEIWETVQVPVTAVANLFGLMTQKTDETRTAMDKAAQSPLIQALQKIWDAITANINIFQPLTTGFASIDQALKNAGQTLQNAGTSWSGVLTFLGALFAVVFGIIVFVVTEVINVLALAIGTIGQIIGTIISAGAQIISGLVTALSGLWEILVGLFTDNPQKIVEGLTKFLGGVDTIVIGLWNMIISTAGQLLGFLVSTVLRILGDLAASIARLLGFPDAANAIKGWVDTAITNIQNFTSSIPRFFEDMAGKVKTWVDQILAWINPLTHLNFNGSANLTGSGGTPGGNAAGGVTRRGKPNLSWTGEGGEQEAIIPLSKLPDIFSQLYGQALAGAGAAGDTYQFNIHDVTVRDDKDIDRIADAVVRKISKKTNNTSRMG